MFTQKQFGQGNIEMSQENINIIMDKINKTRDGEAPDLRYMYIDIETFAEFKDDDIKNYYIEKSKDKRLTDPEKIRKNIELLLDKAALSPFTGKVISTGILYEYADGSLVIKQNYLSDKPFEVDSNKVKIFDNEKDLLEEFWQQLNKRVKIITFEGVRFDIPFLLTRSIYHLANIPIDRHHLHEISLPNKYLIAGKLWHIDLSDRFDCSLAYLGHFFGITNDYISRGDEIASLYANNNHKSILQKNENDLMVLQKVWNKVKDYYF